MRKIVISIALVCGMASSSYMQAMWFAVNPQDKEEYISNGEKSYLLQKLMISISLHSSNLDGDSEMQKITTYCKKNLKKGKNTVTVVCPDPDCESSFSSGHGISGLRSSLRTHWYTTTAHQAKLHALAVNLVSQSKRDAERMYSKSGNFEVIPFPDIEEENEDEEEVIVAPRKRSRERVKSQKDAQPEPLVIAPGKPLLKPIMYYLLEGVPGMPGAFSTFMESSVESLLVSYYKSKQVEGRLLELEPLKEELLQRTKKQQMVQRNVVQSLVCPAQGCKHQCTQVSKHNELEKIAQALVVHYVAFHKKDHPNIQPIIGLIATNFGQARKNLEKGK